MSDYLEVRIAQIIREGGVIYGDADLMAKEVIALCMEEAARCAEKTFGEGYHIAAAIRALATK